MLVGCSCLALARTFPPLTRRLSIPILPLGTRFEIQTDLWAPPQSPLGRGGFTRGYRRGRPHPIPLTSACTCRIRNQRGPTSHPNLWCSFSVLCLNFAVFSHIRMRFWAARWCHTWAIIRDWLNKLYHNSTSGGQNYCAFPRDLLYFHGTFYTRLSERGQTDNISSRWSRARSRENLNGLYWVPCSRNITCYDRSNAVTKSCYFLVSSCSLHFGSFCGEKITYSAFTERILFCKFCSGSFFLPKQKNLELSSMFFSTARPRAWEIFGSSLSEKNVTQLTDFKTKLLIRTKVNIGAAQ